MGVGYPGVTKDVRSDRWDSDDHDDVDNNWRWGSNRLLLDDAILLAVAAEEKRDAGEKGAAARYARHALRVMDYILGTNAMALSMVTGFGEHAVERTHDGHVPDTEPGKLALGPNNWTNSNDPDMPDFGSLPGMKMMPVTGTGGRPGRSPSTATRPWSGWPGGPGTRPRTSWRWRRRKTTERWPVGLTHRSRAHSLSAVRPDWRSPMTRLSSLRSRSSAADAGAASSAAVADGDGHRLRGPRHLAPAHPDPAPVPTPARPPPPTPSSTCASRCASRTAALVLRRARLLRRRRECRADRGGGRERLARPLRARPPGRVALHRLFPHR